MLTKIFISLAKCIYLIKTCFHSFFHYRFLSFFYVFRFSSFFILLPFQYLEYALYLYLSLPNFGQKSLTSFCKWMYLDLVMPIMTEYFEKSIAISFCYGQITICIQVIVICSNRYNVYYILSIHIWDVQNCKV